MKRKVISLKMFAILIGLILLTACPDDKENTDKGHEAAIEFCIPEIKKNNFILQND